MIQIEDKHYIGKGGFQKCYVHPDNNNICLKVKINEFHKDPRVNREVDYYKKIQKRKGEIPFIAKYHGETMTNYGMASLYDLVRDETTNKVSLTLYDYLKMDNSPFSNTVLTEEVLELKQKLIAHKIIVRDLMGKNICCKILKDHSVELVIVDGVGHRDFIPLVDWISFFTKKKIDKIFHKKKLYVLEEHKNWLKAKYPS